MGVYDFFKGECPYCLHPVDHHPEFGTCGDIQTKIFITEHNTIDYFRSFYPGSYTPYFIDFAEYIVGPTSCCDHMIRVIIINSIIQPYERVIVGA